MDPVIDKPTYMADVRFFFTDDDIAHMGAKGIELGTYAGVKLNAPTIFFHTAPPNASMPPSPAKSWSKNRSQTFKNWIVNGCPLGTAVAMRRRQGLAGARVRKSVERLTAEELQALKTAFKGLMDRDPDEPDSYYSLAGIHGRPEPIHCLHHEDRYNPWHRAYLWRFEDALRSVQGCEDVTLAYWDITTDLPAALRKDVFAKYKLPRDPSVGATSPTKDYKNYTTSRYGVPMIRKNVVDYGVLEDITTSRKQSMWGAYNVGGYQKFSIQAHDGGHGSIGPTMADQDVAAFDPVFWFFHCNLDRLWLEWQVAVGATTLAGFRSTIDGDPSFLTPPFNVLVPFDVPPAEAITAEGTIELPVSYEPPTDAEMLDAVVMENMAGNVEAGRRFAIRRSTPVSVRVKDIDRLNIPGTFAVHLLADGKPIAKRAFFQPTSPRDCATCRMHGLVNIDFRVDQERLLDRTLSIEIEVVGQQDMGARFPLSQAGSPTINARLLVEDE